MSEKLQLVIMDPGSAHVVSSLVTDRISCGHNLDGTVGSSGFPILAQSMLICRQLAQLDHNPNSTETDIQCVVMSGGVKRCPFIKDGGSVAIENKLQELQQTVSESLTYSQVGNFHTVSGSALDKS